MDDKLIMRGYDSGEVLREGLLRRIYEEISEIQRRMEKRERLLACRQTG